MAGLLTIATDSGANPELLINAKTGILYSQNKWTELRDILYSVFDNKESYNSIAQRGHDASFAKFNALCNATGVFDLYEQIRNSFEG